jgi:hypothetical protein
VVPDKAPSISLYFGLSAPRKSELSQDPTTTHSHPIVVVQAMPVFTAIKEPPAFRSASGEGFVGRVRVTSLLV